MSWRTRAVKHRRGLWRLSSAVGVITPDDSGSGMHGTMVNAPTWAERPNGTQAIELDGNNQFVNLGDLPYLSAVSAFSIAFWMNQDVIDAEDNIFICNLNVDNRIRINTHNATGEFRFDCSNGGQARGAFDYSTLMGALSWHHVAMVFDGSQTGNADRLIVYLDGTPVTLAFTGTIPAVTADYAGVDKAIGTVAETFDGKLAEFRLYDVALTRSEVAAVMRGR